MSWDDLEQLVVETTVASVRRLIDANPGHTLYVVGMHSVDRELEGMLTLPLLGANSVQAYADQDDSGTQDNLGYWSPRWNPERWRWPRLVRDDPRLLLAEVQLHQLATCGTQSQWMKTEARLWRTLASASKRAGRELAGSSSVTDDFVVLLWDRGGGPQLARRGMSERLFSRHFPEQAAGKREHRRLAALPIDAQIAFLIGRLGQHSGDITTEEAADRLRTIGAPAIGALIDKLDDRQIGWYAAMLLGQIGVPSPEVISALRRQARDARIISHRAWCASALAFLGDADHLIDSRASLPASIVTAGVTAPLSLFRDRCVRPAPLDYRPLERLIETSAEFNAMVEQELNPENGVCLITPAEVDTALAALRSPHRPVRWHATSVLGEAALEPAVAARVVPALSDLVGDHDPVVARLATHGIRRSAR